MWFGHAEFYHDWIHLNLDNEIRSELFKNEIGNTARYGIQSDRSIHVYTCILKRSVSTVSNVVL